MVAIESVSDSCTRIDPQPSDEICPIAGDDVVIRCSSDPTGGMGFLTIVSPNGTSMSQERVELRNIMVSDGGVYTCVTRNDVDQCTPSNATVNITVYC